jgi:peptidyl-prolyl cis-trans isomerase C
MRDKMSGTARAVLGALALLAGPVAEAADTVPGPGVVRRDPAAAGLIPLADNLEKGASTVVAEVDGTKVTMGMVADRLREMPAEMVVLPSTVVYQMALEDLVNQRALAVKARALGMDKDPRVVRRIELATDHELARALALRVVGEMVTEDAVKRQYDQVYRDRPGAEEVQLRVIATRTESDATMVLSRLRSGASFGALAREYSVDPSGPATGGEIGYVRRDLLTPEIGAVAFALAPGQLAAYPVPSGGSWFVIEVEGRRQRSPPTLEEARWRVLGELNRAASEELLAKTRASVVVTDFGPSGGSGSAGAGPRK